MDNWNNKQKIIVQMVCVLLSIALWFYVTNVENPIKTQDINKVPVELMNEAVLRDSNLTLSPGQQFYVNLKIEGTTQDLRDISKDDFEIVIDLSEYAYKIGANKIPVHILDSPSKVAIKNSSSLTLTINIEEYISKDIDITSDVNVVAKPTYYVAPIEFSDTTVSVSGPKSAVDRVNAVVARGEEYNVSETINKSYHLYAVDENGKDVENVQLSIDTVDATIRINEGKVVPIKVNTIGQLGAGMKLKEIVPSVTEVELSGPEDILSSIDIIETDVIDLSGITSDSNMDVLLVIPSNVQVNLGELTSIEVSIKTESQESKELTVETVFNGLGEGLTLNVTNKTVKVKVTGFAEDIKDITAESISSTIDLSALIEAGDFSEAPVLSLTTPNDNIKIETSDKVTFSIEKVQTETPAE